MKFQIVSEGRTDFVVLKNLLIGFFNDKNLLVTPLFPESKEPAGWGNVLNYITTERFQTGMLNTDYMVIQIDTDKCEDWNENLKNSGDDILKLNSLIDDIIDVLISKIGNEFYQANAAKILFAVSVHEIECWLLPFNVERAAKQAKTVGCFNALEAIAIKQGFSLHQKNYQEGKNYETLSVDMKKNKVLMKKYPLNPSLKIFVETLLKTFPQTERVNDLYT